MSIIDEDRPEGPAGRQSSGRGLDDHPAHEQDSTGAEPIFNVPPMVLGLLAIMIGVMLWRLALDPEADTIFVLMLALIPARLAGLASELPGGAATVYTQFVTHMFVHADVMHLAFNGASLLAFAGALEKRIGAFRLLLFFLVCGLAGAVTFIAVNPGLLAPMIGASGAIAGLMGGVMRFFFSALDRGGLWRLNHAPRSMPLMPLSAALQDRRMLAVTASFIIMNIAAMVGFGDLNASNAIAWEAHVGGYLAGLLLFGVFDIAPHHEEFPRNEI